MKWFKHETDAHINLKIQSVINKFGAAGYGYYWACIELVGNQGEGCRVRAEKDWKIHLRKFLDVEVKVQDEMLEFFAEKNLIDSKSLKKGDLYIPKLAERSDDYAKRIRRKFGQDTDTVRTLFEPATDNVPLEQNRTEESRKEQIEMFEAWWVEYPSTKRNCKKADAQQKFLRGSPSVEDLEKRISHLKVQKTTDRKWLLGYIPNMTTYMNQERWNMGIESGIVEQAKKKIHVA